MQETKMLIQLTHKDEECTVDLSRPIDISIPLINGEQQVKCFQAPDYKTGPLVSGDFIGDTEEGSPVNFYNLFINPHGNGTHTECVGHISQEKESIHDILRQFHFIGKLISVKPIIQGEDRIIILEMLEKLTASTECLIIRTLPNDKEKLTRNYSGSNPAYISAEAVKRINDIGVRHLIIDLPSVDREQDEGRVEGHKIFWGYPHNTQKDKTITELVYIPDDVEDGDYLINIQIISTDMDASPSKVVLYKMKKDKS